MLTPYAQGSAVNVISMILVVGYLGLCLLLGAQAQTYYLVNPLVPVILTGEANEEPAFDLNDVSWAYKLPSPDWVAGLWVKLEASVPENAILFQATCANGKPLLVTWPLLSGPTFTYDGQSYKITNNINLFRAYGKWFHILVTSKSSGSLAHVRPRKAIPKPASIAFPSMDIDQTFTFKGPLKANVEDISFAVISK